jgi:Short C-terminal domain
MTSEPETTEINPPPPPPAAADVAAVAERHRQRRIFVGILLTLATIVGLFGIIAVWANRQVLNTDNVTDMSSRILADKQVQTALSAYLVNQLFTSVNVQGNLQSVLPKQLQPLAGPLASGTRQIANSQAPRLLASAKVQAAFSGAVRAAHLTLLKVLNGGGNTVSTHGGLVTLNLRSLITQLASSLGLSSQLAAARLKIPSGAGATVRSAAQNKLGIKLPPASGQLVILRSHQLKAAQDIVKALRSLAILLPLVAFALYAFAVGLAKGWRRRALGACGWCLFGTGIFVLLFRRVGGNALVNNLVKIDSNRPAVHQIWMIATSLLYDIAIAVIVYGLIITLVSWLFGNTRPATAVRRALAPTLRDEPVWTWVTVAIVFLLIVVWGPTPAFRQIIPIIIIGALVALAVELLHRRAAEEFPDARRGDTFRAIRAWYSAHRSGTAATSSADARASHRADELERLAALHDRGVLTDDEFAVQKALVLGPQ